MLVHLSLPHGCLMLVDAVIGLQHAACALFSATNARARQACSLRGWQFGRNMQHLAWTVCATNRAVVVLVG
eukprot:9235801-Alexandrium_andersonii.AAC.1